MPHPRFSLVAEQTKPHLLRLYQHHASHFRVAMGWIPGPHVALLILVPTRCSDDRGLPHTLEHLVFCGSRDYPNRGYLDALAQRCLSKGTNAWTDNDYTAYTLDCAGWRAALSVLPCFLDHVLHPLLRPHQFVTEVFHVDGEGQRQGVVYSEMAAREHNEDDLVGRATHDARHRARNGHTRCLA